MEEQMRLEQLERQVALLQAREEIRDLMGRYQTARCGGLRQELYDRFWSSAEDTSLEIGASGEYKGARNAAAYYQKDLHPGVFQTHILGDPEITVAGDDQTAVGTWLSIGLELDAGELSPDMAADDLRRRLWTGATPNGARYQAEWLVRKLKVQLRREAEGWRFWRVQVFELLRCPMGTDFVSWAEQRFQTDGFRLDASFQSNQPFAPDQPPERMADEPSSSHWQYTWQSLADQLP